MCLMHRRAAFEEDIETCPICEKSEFLSENEIPMSILKWFENQTKNNTLQSQSQIGQIFRAK